MWTGSKWIDVTVGAVPVVAYTDTFDRSDGVGLGTSSGGALWTALAGNFQIISNTARWSSNGAYPAGGVVTMDPGYANATVVADLVVTTEMGFAFRAADGSNLFWVDYYAGTLYLQKIVAGAGTLIRSATPGTTTFTLKVELYGNSINIYVNGVLKISETQTAFNTNTKHGLFSGNFSPETSSTVNNFAITPTAAPAAPGAPAAVDLTESLSAVDIIIAHPTANNRGTVTSYRYEVYEDFSYVGGGSIPVGTGNPLVGGSVSVSATSGTNVYVLGFATNSAGEGPSTQSATVLIP